VEQAEQRLLQELLMPVALTDQMVETQRSDLLRLHKVGKEAMRTIMG
jgi:hypothetical protein